LQVGCIGFQFHSKHDKQGEYCFMNSVASKTPRKIKSLKCRTSFQFMNPPLFSSPNKKRASNLSILYPFTNQKPQTISIPLIGCCCIATSKIGVLILQNRPRPSPPLYTVVGGARNSTSLNGEVAVVL
jgi:hypothetical protein